MSNQLQGISKILSELYDKLNSVTARLNKVDSDIKEYMTKNGLTLHSLFDMQVKPFELRQLVEEQMSLLLLRSSIEKEIGILET
jgi:hypothetical protein